MVLYWLISQFGSGAYEKKITQSRRSKYLCINTKKYHTLFFYQCKYIACIRGCIMRWFHSLNRAPTINLRSLTLTRFPFTSTWENHIRKIHQAGLCIFIDTQADKKKLSNKLTVLTGPISQEYKKYDDYRVCSGSIHCDKDLDPAIHLRSTFFHSGFHMCYIPKSIKTRLNVFLYLDFAY